MLKRLEGIVIKSQDYGETHKIVTVFTKEYGKVAAISRGANKPKSRLRAISQPFVHADFLIYISKGLSTIQQGQIVHSFRQIREDIVKTAYAAFILELTDKVVADKESESFLYNELFHTLRWIDEHDSYMVPLFMYELKLLQRAGIAPVVTHCANCQTTQYPFVFSIREGGLLCDRCRHLDEHAFMIEDNVARILAILLNVSLERVGTISVKPKNIHMLRTIFDHYYDTYGGYTLKSRKFLEQLNLLE
ncbi:MAG TPA: DNA repair protein RecO [Pseudogracilibacillus sp.]|nr:DNA repair protein RecO [Pseudogracilibacillus sp.]